ncbi:hypothetical protein LOTGIDRAFT_130484 [Lottia gigantea]|uniref:Probable ATP-dependent RNA helicase DDX46 n=1 Tax=Lottia gigantea TaxID=225164 RepID=V3ZXU2_LOTGI|nr:hypothetical protein LOTGIDRAFT_130484 [Lottia gigantea]ESO85806.1 hypothetical protein LOTGIDRAFT_130484 [Lottia gigantea]
MCFLSYIYRSYRRRSRSRSRSVSRERKRKKKSRSRSVERKRSRSRDRSRRDRSKDRRRSRSRSRDRDRRRKRRSRSRSRSRDRNKVKSCSPSKEKVIHREGALTVKDEPLNKEEEQKRLEMEMQKRRERIEQWRAERKKTKELVPINIAPPTKTWTLEDEDDDDEDVESEEKKAGDADEVDPLDAYMQNNGTNANGTTVVTTTAPTTGKVTFITAVAKKKAEPIFKGELMESNQDAMEYSSEEEEEGIDVTMANIDKMKKKDLVVVDHTRIYYAPFRKNFYVDWKRLIGIAKTGSGKTLAFLLPMFRHILDQPPLDEEDGPICVILTPTRELALQIASECKKFAKPLGLQTVCVYGGTGISEQIAELKRGCEIIVCTPGRMIDMLAANNGRVTNLRRCTYVVLDEADRMFDMGFEPQVMKIIDNVRPDRQTVMFSATFPRQMEALARRILDKPIEVQVGGRSVVCQDVQQHVILIDEDQKFFKLLELLGLYHTEGSALVFVDKQEHADDLMKDLMSHSYPCLSLHGGIDQYDRDSTIVDFKNGVVKLLIATSVAARGLDVKQLDLVVNYDCPNHYEDYVHRCGRTGRAGNKGQAYTFITPEQERYAGDIIKSLELSGATVPADVQLLWTSYIERAKAEGKKVKSSSGFKGKGFKFDETEAQLADDRRKLQKAALGLQDSDDEDAGVDIDQKIEDMFASVKRVTDVAKPIANLATQQASTNLEKLELAKRLAARINMSKNLGPDAQDITQQAAMAFLKGDTNAPQVKSKTIAEQMAEKINAKLGYRPQVEEDKEAENAEETFKCYEEELDINDFPQTARWKVTSREALAQICEYSEAGITVRGTYISGKRELQEGERKLYLAIEGTSELSISKAKKEVTRLIKEELIRLVSLLSVGILRTYIFKREGHQSLLISNEINLLQFATYYILRLEPCLVFFYQIIFRSEYP